MEEEDLPRCKLRLASLHGRVLSLPTYDPPQLADMVSAELKRIGSLSAARTSRARPGPLCSSTTSAAPLAAQAVSPEVIAELKTACFEVTRGKVEIDDEDEGGDLCNCKFSLIHTLISNTFLPQAWYALQSRGLNDWGNIQP